MSAAHPGPSAGAPDGLDAALERCAGPVARRLDRHLVEQMLQASQELGLDYESLVLWVLLADATAAGDGAVRPLHVTDLAQAAALPRETARRKLLALEAAGCAVHVAGGWIARPVPTHLARRRRTRASVERLLGTADAIHAMLADATGAPAPDEADRRTRRRSWAQTR